MNRESNNKSTPSKSTPKRNIQPLSEKSLNSINDVSRIASQYNNHVSTSQSKSKTIPMNKPSSSSSSKFHSNDKSNNSRATTPNSRNSRPQTPTQFRRPTLDDTRSQGTGSVKNLVQLFSTMSSNSSAKHNRTTSSINSNSIASKSQPISASKAKPLSIKENNEIAKKFRQNAQAKMAEQLALENEKLSKSRDHSPFRPNRNILQDDVSRMRSRNSSKNPSNQSSRPNSALRATSNSSMNKSYHITHHQDADVKGVYTSSSKLTQKTQSMSDVRLSSSSSISATKTSHSKSSSSVLPDKNRIFTSPDKAAKAVNRSSKAEVKDAASARHSEMGVNSMLERMQRKNDSYEGNIEISKLLQAAAKKLEVYIESNSSSNNNPRYARSNSFYTRSSSSYNNKNDDDSCGRDMMSRIPTKMDVENMLRYAYENRIRELKLGLAAKSIVVDTCAMEGLFRGYNILTVAAWHGNIDIVKYLVESKGANIMHRQPDGVIPIYIAAQYGYIDCLKYMLDRGPDISEDQMNQILMFAVKGAENHPKKFQSCDKVVRLLISRGADPNYADPNQNYSTPLLQVVKWYHYDPKNAWTLILAKILLTAQADPHKRDATGVSALILAAAQHRATGNGMTKNPLLEILDADKKSNQSNSSSSTK